MAYVIGMDFGTLSARAVLADTETGHVHARSVSTYASGIMDRFLPDGREAMPGTALQRPEDYLSAMTECIQKLLEHGGVENEEIAGLSMDFTCTTCLPVDAQLQPLSGAYPDRGEAMIKLWKHHAAEEARELTDMLRRRGVAWLDMSGGRLSAEWLAPKLLQTARRDAEVYERMDAYMEAGDWLISLLVGEKVRSLSYALYKNLYQDGFPRGMFAEIESEFAGFEHRLFDGRVVPVLGMAGRLCPEMARKLSLPEGMPVGAGLTDSHTPVLQVGGIQDGDVVSILGTSACHLLQSGTLKCLGGVAGLARDGIVPGLTSYEINHSFGEILAWHLNQAVPEDVFRQAEEQGMQGQAYLVQEALKLPPGAGGLMALPWFNGDRCLLSDPDLTGMILGLRLNTTPYQVCRALMEAVCMSVRQCLEHLETGGLHIGRVIATGGVAHKSPGMMQLLADILGRPVLVSRCEEGSAQGSALVASVMSGVHADVEKASAAMAEKEVAELKPVQAGAYEEIYARYRELAGYFGRDSRIMHELR